MDCLQRCTRPWPSEWINSLRATVVEYGAPQDRAKGSNNLAANIFLHFRSP